MLRLSPAPVLRCDGHIAFSALKIVDAQNALSQNAAKEAPYAPYFQALLINKINMLKLTLRAV